MTTVIRQATRDDERTLLDLQAEAIRWLADKGEDQWQPGQPRAPQDGPGNRMSEAIAQGTCWVVVDDGEIVATVIIDDVADPEFWSSSEAPDALYVHRMIVRRQHAGRGLGELLLTWADQLASRAGRNHLRLDAWCTNTRLHNYYRRQGFAHVRTVNLPHRGSGALFERSVLHDAVLRDVGIPADPGRLSDSHDPGGRITVMRAWEPNNDQGFDDGGAA
jgi:GNAT superfamily N-acetyltransferase